METRVCLAFIEMNQTKYYFWKHDLYEKYPSIHDEMNNIFNNLTNLKLLSDLYQNVACPHIHYDKLKIKKIIHSKILRRKIKFKYDKTEKWGLYERQQLLVYIDSKDDNWQLNRQTLEEIYLFFKQRFSIKQLKLACYYYGYSFNTN